MTTTGIDLDALPPGTLVVENGKITPVGEQVAAQIAKDLAAVCRRSHDPQAAFRLLREVLPKLIAETSLESLVAKHNLHVKEADASTLPELLRDKFMASHMLIEGRAMVVVPKGQDPIERLHAVRRLLNHLEMTA